MLGDPSIESEARPPFAAQSRSEPLRAALKSGLLLLLSNLELLPASLYFPTDVGTPLISLKFLPGGPHESSHGIRWLNFDHLR